MTKLLLDFPWNLDAILDQYSEAFGVLLDFDRLRTQERMEIARFVDRAEYDEMWSRIGERNVGGNVYRPLMQFLPHCLRLETGTVGARPSPEPPGLRQVWKYALRDQMADFKNWRNPQIVVCQRRRDEWYAGGPHTDEVSIRCDDGPPEEVHYRVLAVLSSYRDHRFTLSDLDPWDLRHSAPEPPAGHLSHPCYLPKPPSLVGVPLHLLDSTLPEARRLGWQIGGRYYFLPPLDFQAADIGRPIWRRGRAFRRANAPLDRGQGPVDLEGRIWVWHEAERHWDVQLAAGDHLRVSHTGERLP